MSRVKFWREGLRGRDFERKVEISRQKGSEVEISRKKGFEEEGSAT